MRKVEIYGYKTVLKDGRKYQEKYLSGEGFFHQFGCDYEEFETGSGNYSTAIVELGTGEIKNVPVENVVFLEPQEPATPYRKDLDI